MKEIALDKATVDAYHEWVQRGIRNDLNSISLGPGKMPYRTGLFLLFLAFVNFLVGVLLVALRGRHVYLWDWNAQFLGPFFIILFLLCLAGAIYFFIKAKRRSNSYRSQLYFKPVGDWGVSCVHKSELARVEEFKHDLKSGTTPHKTIKPRSEAYSQSSKDVRKAKNHDGRDNAAYDHSPVEEEGKGRPQGRYGQNPDAHAHKGPPPPSARRGPPPEGRRGPPPDGKRGPPPDGRRGPPPDGRRGPPPDGRRGPPPDGRRGPPSDGRRGPPPDGRRPPHPDQHVDHNGRGDRRPPGAAVHMPMDENQARRPRGAPRFGNVERIPDEHRHAVQNIQDKSGHESESEI